ncbi:MAG: NADH-quinone oxidoreductase subunit L [Fibrobacteria bacterium]|nr:NADH-quinone oxidoreductase subunit L [Fibrobacteria bacterium]
MVEFNYLWLIPVLPLIGAAISGTMGLRIHRRFGEKGINLVSITAPWLAFVVALIGFVTLLKAPSGTRLYDNLWVWMSVGGLKANIAFSVDALSGMMMMIITFIGSLIHIYASGYMKGDESYWRFFACLNLFMFAMLVLVLGDNLLLMFVGWEGVGLCSYLLIGFWYKDVNNAKAGMKAFVVNRVGDFGFLAGLMILFWGLGGSWTEAGYHAGGVFSVTFAELPELVALAGDKTLWGVPIFTLVGICFFVGATGKSAQIPLYVWLPDAMAGPTPVSALIHAATMVTAGVYMIARMNFMYIHSPLAMTIIALVGACTALFAATIGCVQYDIKKVLAYSTVSQLGYMFIGVGVGAYWCGAYHLLTHAFFKACLFLGSGSVILAMHHEQDMRKMGGLGKHMPLTRWTYFISCIAIAGFPIASGFYSKDEILWKAFNSKALLIPGWVPWAMGFVAAGLTSFYMWRSYFMTFTGPAPKVHAHHGDAHDDAHASDEHSGHGHDEGEYPKEQPFSMTGVLAVLAIGAVAVSFIGLPYLWTHQESIIEKFLHPVFKAADHLPTVYHHGEGHGVEWLLMICSVTVATLGLGIAWVFYRGRTSQIPDKLKNMFSGLHRVVHNKYYVDEAYHATAVKGFLGTAFSSSWFDQKILDGIVNGLGHVTKYIAYIDGFIDTYLVDGIVNLVGLVARSLGGMIRKLQTGQLSTYLTGMVVSILLIVVITGLFFN